MQRNKLLTSKNLILFIALFLFFNTNMVLGGTVTIETIADGAVNAPVVDTDSDSTNLYRSFISWKSIFEFDLSPNSRQYNANRCDTFFNLYRFSCSG